MTVTSLNNRTMAMSITPEHQTVKTRIHPSIKTISPIVGPPVSRYPRGNPIVSDLYTVPTASARLTFPNYHRHTPVNTYGDLSLLSRTKQTKTKIIRYLFTGVVCLMRVTFRTHSRSWCESDAWWLRPGSENENWNWTRISLLRLCRSQRVSYEDVVTGPYRWYTVCVRSQRK